MCGGGGWVDARRQWEGKIFDDGAADADVDDAVDMREFDSRSRQGSVGVLSTSVAGLLRRAEAGGSIRRFWPSRACLSSVLRGPSPFFRPAAAVAVRCWRRSRRVVGRVLRGHRAGLLRC